MMPAKLWAQGALSFCFAIFRLLAGVAFAQRGRCDIGISQFKNLLGCRCEEIIRTLRIDAFVARKNISPVDPQAQPELLLCNCELSRNIPAASDLKIGADI